MGGLAAAGGGSGLILMRYNEAQKYWAGHRAAASRGLSVVALSLICYTSRA